jgi:hypothetical protein
VVRLPTIASDVGQWGQLINDFLLVGHNADGTIKNTSQIIDARDYGVVADLNGTNDAPAINAAITAASQTAYAAAHGLSGNDTPAVIVQLPYGHMRIDSPVLLKANVSLRAHGAGSWLNMRGADTTFNAIQLATGNEANCEVRDLCITSNNAATAGAGIDLTKTGGASVLGDARYRIENVLIVGCWVGINAPAGSTEMRLDSVTVQRAKSHGIYVVATDTFITNCTVGGSTGASSSAFKILGGNSRIWGCKAFGSTGSNSIGFEISGAGRHEVACCEAQDINGLPLSVGGNTPSQVLGFMADSCQQGIKIDTDTAGINWVEAVVLNRNGGTYATSYALDVRNFSAKLHIVLRTEDFTGSNPIKEITRFDANNVSGTFEINNSRGWQRLNYAASITPLPYSGGTIIVAPLTGDVTINNPAATNSGLFFPGQEMRLLLTQDGVGGRVTTFGAAYKTTGAISTTAGSTTTISFIYDGTYWREISRTVT